MPFRQIEFLGLKNQARIPRGARKPVKLLLLACCYQETMTADLFKAELPAVGDPVGSIWRLWRCRTHFWIS